MKIITNFKMCVMKLNKYFMMGAMGLSLVACSDNLDENGQSANGTNPNEGTTYVGIALDFGQSVTSRAKYDGSQPETGTPDAGTGGERDVNSVRIIITNTSNVIEKNVFYGSSALQGQDGLGKYVFPITPGEKRFYAFLNEEDGNSDLTATSGTLSNEDLAKAASSFYTSGGTNNATATDFAMSSTDVVEQEIVDNVSQEEATSSSSVNQVKLEVERMVAKVSVALDENMLTNQDNAFTLKALDCKIGNADNYEFTTPSTYTSAGTYRWANNDATGGYRTTPYYSWPATPESAFESWNETYVLSEAQTVYNGTTPSTAIFYCLENTHAVGSYRQGNTTFIRVEATMIPKQVMTFSITGDADKTITPQTPADVSGVDNAKTFYRIVGAPEEHRDNFINTYIFEDELSSYTTALGVDDLADVIAALETEGYAFEKYDGGKGNYTLWVNDYNTDADDKNNNLAPVFRNDWYAYTINSIQLPGNSGGIDDPEQPIHPDTWLGVTLTIKPWNFKDIDIDLQ